ncbi:hypothetical protein GW844_02310 [bacterium]|nr:hypothetical protein [bacterium]
MDNNKLFANEYIQIGALTAMISMAKSMGIEYGVALVLCRKKNDQGISYLKFDAVDNTFFSIRTNYLAIAMSKLAVSMRLGVDSGTITEDLLAGETGYRGCKVRFEVIGYEKWEIYTSFSGGTEIQDLEISKLGMAMLFPK